MDEQTMQGLHLEILRRSQCNDLDGERIVRDLEAHRELWLSVYPVRESGGEEVTLRDLTDDGHAVDTVYVMCTPENSAAMMALARTWGPDELDAKPRRYGGGQHIIRAWFD